MDNQLIQALKKNVESALAEDIGSGDITARLIPASRQACATLITREPAILCGTAWANEVFRQLDPDVQIEWHCCEGAELQTNQKIATLTGSARSLLTGERTALNFLQLLSGTATVCRQYTRLVEGTQVKLLDTRKTIPGLRLAQKYAVTIGGCCNHRIGLYDAFLIKENHIMACGGIVEAVTKARQQEPGKPVEIEVETLSELNQALQAAADIIMLDNFTLEDMRQAVLLNQSFGSSKAKLEASGGITLTTLRWFAETGVDYISIGALTKDCKAIDLSMRIDV